MRGNCGRFPRSPALSQDTQLLAKGILQMTVTETPTSTKHEIDTAAERIKFLRRVLLRDEDWTMRALASDDWQITFRRTIKGKPGDPDVDIVVTIKDKITLAGKYGKQRSFSDADEVYVPQPDRVHLSYGAVKTLAKFLLEDSHILITGSSGSTSSSKHGIAIVSLSAMVKGCNDSVTIGHDSIYVNGKIVMCGSVE